MLLRIFGLLVALAATALIVVALATRGWLHASSSVGPITGTYDIGLFKSEFDLDTPLGTKARTVDCEF